MFIAAMLSSGCATIVKGSRQEVEIKTTPAGLVARINTQQCITPCTMQNVSRKSENIFITHNGIEKTYELDKSFNFWSTIMGNIWNEIWPGMLIDMASGAFRDIEPVTMDFVNYPPPT